MLAVILSAVFIDGPQAEALARELPGQMHTERLRACPDDSPDDYAVLPDPPEEDDGEEDKETASVGPGFALAAGDCLFPSLEVTTGNQSARIGGRLGTILGPRARNPYSSQLNTILGFTHVNYTWTGGLVTTIRFEGSGEAALSQASIHSRYFGFGLMGSRFDEWAGDEFSFRAIAPSQSPIIASVVPWRSDTSIFVLSAEDPSFRRVTLSG